MRLATSFLAAAAALALLPGAAQAKELTKARACDADGCQAITAASKLRGMEEGTPTAAPKQGAPFYRIRMTVKIDKGQTDSWTLVYVPSQGCCAPTASSASSGSPRRRAGSAGSTASCSGLEPQPASALRGVGVERRRRRRRRSTRSCCRPTPRPARRRLPVDRAPDPGRPAARGRRLGGAPARAARPFRAAAPVRDRAGRPARGA